MNFRDPATNRLQSIVFMFNFATLETLVLHSLMHHTSEWRYSSTYKFLPFRQEAKVFGIRADKGYVRRGDGPPAKPKPHSEVPMFQVNQQVLNIVNGKVIAEAVILEFLEIGGEKMARCCSAQDFERGTKRQLIAWNKTWAAPLANLAIKG
jgi:hypothetical protein